MTTNIFQPLAVVVATEQREEHHAIRLLQNHCNASPAEARGGGGRSRAAQSVTVPLQFDVIKAAVVIVNHAVSDATANSVPLVKVQHIEIGAMMFSNVDGFVDARVPATLMPTTPQGVIGLGLAMERRSQRRTRTSATPTLARLWRRSRNYLNYK
jgi:hypothetical protein